MGQFSLYLNTEILDKIEKSDLNIECYTILTLYRFRNVFGDDLLKKIISLNAGNSEHIHFSQLCRVGLLERLDPLKTQDIENYKLTLLGQTF